MSQSNYFILSRYPYVKLVGFTHMKETAFIHDISYKRTLVVECENNGNQRSRFPVHLKDDHTIADETLYLLLHNYQLDQKQFIYDELMKFYFPTNIKAGNP